jgi:hypothetical protein
MTTVSKRHEARTHVPPLRVSIGVVVLLALGALAACVSDGTPTGATPPSGITGVGGGTSGGGGGGSSGNTGAYTLASVNDTAPPVQLFYDSVSGGDTTTVFAATIDSSFIQLNANGTATEWDYLAAYESRVSTIPGDSNFNRTVSVFDSTTGTYTVSGTVLTLTREDSAGTFVTQFTVSTGTLTGEVPFTVYNSYGFPVSGTVTLVYKKTGTTRTAVVRSSRDARAAGFVPAGRLHVELGARSDGPSTLRRRSP